MTDDLFRFSTTLEVRWRDVDALGHVNNAVYLSYLEQVRIHYFRRLGLGFESWDDAGMILAEVTCTYRAPLALGEQVTIWMRVSELRNSSFVVDYRIDGQDGRLAATARTIQVCYDYRANRTVPIPDRWRALMTAFESGLG
ncbi:MAG: acyl-CoA thioesterase [Anaerolineae bacterium]|nr:acyl-CoA thioesterase [Anaerolineae bacterium]